MTASGVFAAEAADFFVSTDGRDAWSGRLDAPNGAKTDGPLATIARAKEAVRALRAKEPGRQKPVVVLIRGGTYFLDEPLTFTADDSGTAASPTIYTAYADEKPVISAGRAIGGWKADGEGRWVTQLPDVASGKWDFIQLFVNGQRRFRPRLPKEGYFIIADAMGPSTRSAGKGHDRFKFGGTDIRGEWANLGDVEVLAFHNWTMSRLRIDTVDEKEKVVTFTGNTRNLQYWSAMPKGNRYLVENVKEAMGPGQWYLERKTGALTYWPLPGEDMGKAQVIAPRLEAIVQLSGDAAAKRWVSNLVFGRLTFAHNNWSTPPEGHNYPQAEVNLPGAIRAEATRACAFEECTVRSVATYAFEFGAACRGNRVRGCLMTDLGAGGVKIGLTRLEENAELLTAQNEVRDNLMSHGGRVHPAAVGVWIGHSPENRVEHNEIVDFYYTGVSVGWLWGYKPSAAHHNVIAYNHIHKIGQAVLSDMGGIYTLGPADGTVLHHNLIHDIDAFTYGGWGIYFDEGTTHILAENNIVYNTKTGGFHQHYGKENTVRNNVFAFARIEQIQRSRMEPHLSFTFERNIVYWNAGPLLGSNWSDRHFEMQNNLYWRTDGKPIDFKGKTWETWRESGQDKESIIADPLFENAAKYDFRLKADSPAEKIGFKPIDITKVGPSTKFPAVEEVAPAFPVGRGK